MPNDHDPHYQRPSVEDAADNGDDINGSCGPNTPTSDSHSQGDSGSEHNEKLETTSSPSDSDANEQPETTSSPSESDGNEQPETTSSSSESDNDDNDNERTHLIPNEQQASQQLANIFGNLVPHMNFCGADALAAIMTAVKKYLVELPKQVYKQVKMWKEENPVKFWIIVACVILGISLPITIHLIGFTAGGIAAGSIAAGIHAGIGNVVAGSAFAFLQSVTATGLLAGVSVGFAAAVPVLAAFIDGLQKDGWARRFFCWMTGRGNA